MANVTRDRSLGATCILLNCFVPMAALHFLFHLDILFHLFLGFKCSLSERIWNARQILTYWGLGRCCWGGPCTRTVHRTFIYNALLLIELTYRLFLTRLCQREGFIPLFRSYYYYYYYYYLIDQ